MNRFIDPASHASLASNPRASLSSWLRYEPIVVEAFTRQPGTYKFTPSGLSTKTVCSRIRDAVRGKLAFDYPSSLLTPDLERWWQTVIVYDDGESVFIGPKGKKLNEIKGHAPGDFAHTWSNISQFELDAIELLMARERLKGPIRIISITGAIIHESFHPNIQRIFKPDGSLILL